MLNALAKNIDIKKQFQDYFYLTLTIVFGVLISVLVFLLSLNIETNKYRSEFNLDSDSIALGLDLIVANQTIRLQNFEENIDSHNIKKKANSYYILSTLKNSIFSSFTYLHYQNRKKSLEEPLLKKSLTINYLESQYSPLSSPSIYVESKIVKDAILHMTEHNEKYRLLFVENKSSPVFSLIWRSTIRTDGFFIFSGPAKNLFDKRLPFKEGVKVVINQLLDDTHWIFEKEEKGISIKKVEDDEIQDHLRSSRFIRSYTQRFGSNKFFKVSIVDKTVDNVKLLWPLVLLGASLLITALFSFLIYSLITRNLKISEIVEKRTVDLEVASKKALDAAYSKNRFLANVSHEIRTPLNIILGMADLLNDTDLTEKQKTYTNAFYTSGKHLLALIDDILDMVRVDSKEVKFKMKEVNFLNFLEETCSFIFQNAKNKKLNFYLSIDPNLPVTVFTDAAHLRQVLINLLSNAIKYTDRGNIHLSAKVIPNDTVNDKRVKVEFSVKDTGIGIPEGSKAEIFNAFYQVDSSVRRSQGGVGLGLSIVHSIVKRMSGSIDVTSSTKGGSCFFVQLPFQPLSNRNWSQSFDRAPDRKSSRYLLVTDDNQLATIFSNYVTKFGHSVDIYGSGKIDDHTLQNKKFAQVFMDSSIDVKHLSLNLEAVPDDNVIIVEDNQKNFFQDNDLESRHKTINKLILPTQLFAILNPVLHKEETTVAQIIATTVEVPKEEGLPSFSILLVDDDAGNRALFKAYLEGKNWDVRYASQGQEALDMCLKNPPDILLTDLQMPVMDGFTLIERINAFKKTGQTKPEKIIVLTADSLDETLEQAETLNVDFFLRKPIRKTEFFDTINSARSEINTEPMSRINLISSTH